MQAAMMKKLIVCAVAALSIHASSQANVVYEWQGNNDATPYNITLRMEFTDAAFAAGVLHLSASEYEFHPETGLVAFDYTFPGRARPVSYAPQDHAFGTGEGLQMDIVFRDDLTLSGSFKATGIESHIFMDSVGSLFTVTNANSDAGMPWAGCTPFANCAGATGVFRQVPEPGSLALVGLGLLGLARRVRAKRAKPAPL